MHDIKKLSIFGLQTLIVPTYYDNYLPKYEVPILE